jgi:ABC-2 type transport system permease protein
VSKLKLKKPEIKGQFKTRKSKSGSYSVLLTVIVIAIAVIVNLVVAELPSKYTNVDLSPNKMYSIGDETKNVVKNLNTDVRSMFWLPKRARMARYRSF